jgi:hypothetical protein
MPEGTSKDLKQRQQDPPRNCICTERRISLSLNRTPGRGKLPCDEIPEDEVKTTYIKAIDPIFQTMP